jgi:5'-nucleotidase / UDP-sugar diphosphatase
MFSKIKSFRASRFAMLISVLAVLSACGGDSVSDAPISVTLLHINDHHSRLDEETTTLQLRNAAGATKAVTLPMGGFGRVAAAISEETSKSTNVIKLHAGDALTGDLYFTQSEGEADAMAMNTVCFDAMSFGNHEFDTGDAGLAKFIGFLNKDPKKCQTALLSSNVTTSTTSPIAGKFQPYTTVTRDGQKIGIVGVTISQKTKNASRPDVTTVFSDEVISTQSAIDALTSQGVNKIVVMSHVGYEFDVTKLATKLKGVDVVVGGDSHTLLGPDSMKSFGLSPEGAYPTKLTDANGQPVCVVQAWQYSYVVGKLKVDFDSKGQVSACNGSPMVLVGDTFKEGSATSTTADAAAYKKALNDSGIFRITTPLADTVTALKPFSDAKVALGSVLVGKSSENLCLRRVPGIGAKSDVTRSSLGDICNKDAGVIARGGDIQQLVAQAFLLQGQTFGGADIALQNAGGVRIDIAAGDITVGKVYTLLPFKNVLVRIAMTGQQVKDTVEDGIDSMLGNNGGTGSGAYPYTAGLRFDVDITKAKGARATNLEVQSNGQWVSFDTSKTYKVITNDFTAGGGDNYLTLKGIDKSLKENTFLDYADSFLQYVKKNPSLSKPAASTFSTKSYRE